MCTPGTVIDVSGGERVDYTGTIQMPRQRG